MKNSKSEAEMNSYRFGCGDEPSDEMLAQIMKEVAEDARVSNEEALKRNFEELEKGIEEQQAKLADRINVIKNGE